MTLEGPQFYDDASVFQTYASLREGAGTANDTLERPVVFELLGEVRGLDFLDLGCGDAVFGRELLERGAASYVGIDGSSNMIAAAARTLKGTRGKALHADIRAWEYPRDTVDRVTSRLALHYLQDLDPVFAKAHAALRAGGRFVFSVEHPIITSCDKVWGGNGLRQDWLVDNYFATGRRVTNWLGAQVVKYHRTVENYFSALQSAGFVVESVRESCPDRRYCADEATFERRKRIPLFLFMAGRKQ